jgi:hypothetical protein
MSMEDDAGMVYERILVLVQRIGRCQGHFGGALSADEKGGLQALGCAGQILDDARELYELLQSRNDMRFGRVAA